MIEIKRGNNLNVQQYIREYTQAKGPDCGKTAAVMLGRSQMLLDVLMALISLQITYIPIDPQLPDNRVAEILADSRPDFMITEEQHRDRIHGTPVLCIPEEMENSEERVPFRFADTLADYIVYILYTSGSTGKPKGVKVKKSSLQNLSAGWYRLFSEYHSIVCLASLSFDMFFSETILPLLHDYQVYLGNESEMNNPKLLEKKFAQTPAEVAQFTPSRLKQLLLIDPELSCLKHVKLLFLGGENLHPSLLKLVKSKLTCKVYNIYGPTETTIYATYCDLTEKDEVVIGKPFDNYLIDIVDENFCRLPKGRVGEIVISGISVADGYLHQKELTERSFRKNLLYDDTVTYLTGDLGYVQQEGEIHYVGRKDHQVKLRGFRIELEEIEKKAEAYPGVSAAVCVVYQEKVLALCYTASEYVEENGLRAYLQDSLPNYMVPSYLIRFKTFAYTVTGKIDRNQVEQEIESLLAASSQSHNDRLFDDEVSRKILEAVSKQVPQPITKKLCSVPLMELGIDSILYIELVVALEEEFDIEFDENDLMEGNQKDILTMIRQVKDMLGDMDCDAKD